jgi:hypothetical protein
MPARQDTAFFGLWTAAIVRSTAEQGAVCALAPATGRAPMNALGHTNPTSNILRRVHIAGRSDIPPRTLGARIWRRGGRTCLRRALLRVGVSNHLLNEGFEVGFCAHGVAEREVLQDQAVDPGEE